MFDNSGAPQILNAAVSAKNKLPINGQISFNKELSNMDYSKNMSKFGIVYQIFR